jgi:hypothetical protein
LLAAQPEIQMAATNKATECFMLFPPHKTSRIVMVKQDALAVLFHPAVQDPHQT